MRARALQMGEMPYPLLSAVGRPSRGEEAPPAARSYHRHTATAAAAAAAVEAATAAPGRPMPSHSDTQWAAQRGGGGKRTSMTHPRRPVRHSGRGRVDGSWGAGRGGTARMRPCRWSWHSCCGGCGRLCSPALPTGPQRRRTRWCRMGRNGGMVHGAGGAERWGGKTRRPLRRWWRRRRG